MDLYKQKNDFIGTQRSNNINNTVNVKNYNKYRENNDRIKSYNVKTLTSLKSPDISDIESLSESNFCNSPQKLLSDKRTPFTIQESVYSSPKLESKNDETHYKNLLGRENNFNISSNDSYYSGDSVLSARNNKNRTKHIETFLNNNDDYNTYYKPKNVKNTKTQKYEINSQFKTRSNTRKYYNDDDTVSSYNDNSVKSEYKRQFGRNNYSVDISVSSNDVIKSNTPNFEEMDENDISYYENKFRLLFEEIKKKHPYIKFEIPNIGEISLRSVFEQYEDLIDAINIALAAKRYRVYLILFFCALEGYFYRYKGIRAAKNFASIQIKGINKYNNFVLDAAKYTYSRDGVFGGKFGTALSFLSNMFTCVGIQGLFNYIGKSAPESMIYEADKFIGDGNNKLKYSEDGISEIPEPKIGDDDPDKMFQNINEYYNLASDAADMMENMKNPQPAEPVPEAKKERKKYDNIL